MGTRASIKVFDSKNQILVHVYTQYDGYPSGVGKEMLAALAGKKLVNGLSFDKNIINGMNCFAAMLVSSLKKGAGGIYIYPPNDLAEWADYYYQFSCPNYNDENRYVHLKVRDRRDKELYSGPFSEWDAKDDSEDED